MIIDKKYYVKQALAQRWNTFITKNALYEDFQRYTLIKFNFSIDVTVYIGTRFITHKILIIKYMK